MDEATNYLDKLRRDLLEQFRGQPNIEVFQRALSRQLSELQIFFSQLNDLRYLKDAEGVQLDGIGDIVVLSRNDALVISKLAGKDVPMDDDAYRLYLAFKIHLNTSNCTHTDIYRAIKMFWDSTPLYYSEDPKYPATMIFSTPTLSPDVDFSPLVLMPTVKAAGVALHYMINVDVDTSEYDGMYMLQRTREAFVDNEDMPADFSMPVYSAMATHEPRTETFIDNEDMPQNLFEISRSFTTPWENRTEVFD